MKLISYLKAAPAIVAVAIGSLALAFCLRVPAADAQLVTAPVIGTLTAACTSDPCNGPISSSVATIAVPGGASVCAGNIWGTFQAGGTYEVTNDPYPTAVIAHWQPVLVAPINGWIANNSFSTATSRAFAVYWNTPLRAVGYLRIRITAYTSGTVNYILSCAGAFDNIQSLPGITPTASPTP